MRCLNQDFMAGLKKAGWFASILLAMRRENFAHQAGVATDLMGQVNIDGSA